MKRLLMVLLLSTCAFAQTSVFGPVKVFGPTSIPAGGGGGQTWTRVQHTNCSTGGATSLTCTFGLALTANNLVACVLGTQSTTSITSVKDGNNNALNADVTLVASALSLTGIYSEVVPSGATTIVATITFDGASMACGEYSGGATVSILDKTASKDNGFSPANGNWDSSATLGLAQTNELVLGAANEFRAVGAETWTAGAGFFTVDSTSTAAQVFLEDNLSAGTGSGTATNAAVTATGSLNVFVNSQTTGLAATYKHP